jgi:hypothetical protein
LPSALRCQRWLRSKTALRMHLGSEMIVHQKNFATGVLYILFGAGAAIMASSYEIGTPYNMGPGFFPFGVGVALVIVGLCLLVPALLPGATPSVIGPFSIKTLAIVLGSVVLFGLMLEPLGLALAVPALLVVSASAHPQFSWRETLLLVVLLVPFVWVVFVVLLGLQFPLLPAFLAA